MDIVTELSLCFQKVIFVRLIKMAITPIPLTARSMSTAVEIISLSNHALAIWYMTYQMDSAKIRMICLVLRKWWKALL